MLWSSIIPARSSLLGNYKTTPSWTQNSESGGTYKQASELSVPIVLWPLSSYSLLRPLCIHFTFKSSGFFLLRYFFSSTWLPMFASFASAVSFLSSYSPADSPLHSLVLNAGQSHSARPPHIPHVCLEASACGSGIHPWYHGLCSGQ